MRPVILSVSLCFLAAFSAARSYADSIYYLTTGQSNANTTIDAGNEMTWTNPGPTGTGQTCLVARCTTLTTADFSPDFDWDLGGGIFTIKTNAATDNIFLNIWDVTNGAIGGTPDSLTGTLVASAYADGTTKNCVSTATVQCVPNAYTPVDFFFATPVSLVDGDEYVATLTSNTGTNGDQQYDIKGVDQLSIQDSTGGGGNPLTNPDSTPEPSTWMMMAGAFILAAASHKVRRFGLSAPIAS